MQFTLPHILNKIISGYSISKDTVGMSPAKVYKLIGSKDILYLKISNKRFKGTTYDVEREKDILLWLENKANVPKVVHFESDDNHDYLLMSKMDGVCLHEMKDNSPYIIVEKYAECIKMIQAIDITDCPFNCNINFRLSELDYFLRNKLAAEDDFCEDNKNFSSPEHLLSYLKSNIPTEEQVFSHGDLCDSNIFVTDNGICSFIDWGRGGIADKWYDIAFCIRSIREKLGNEKYVDLFFELLGAEPDWDKIEYFILLDILF